jgi:hypothetical protein
MNALACASSLAAADKGAKVALLSQTDFVERLFLLACHIFEVVPHGPHDANIIYLFGMIVSE